MKKTIVICEDDEGIIEISTIVLENKGYNVIPLLNCENIYTCIEKVKPDLLLLDLWMPNINGEEVTRTLKQDEETQHIPIIIVSANKDTERIAQQSGADDFICKPFDIEELEHCVEKFLS